VNLTFCFDPLSNLPVIIESLLGGPRGRSFGTPEVGSGGRFGRPGHYGELTELGCCSSLVSVPRRSFGRARMCCRPSARRREANELSDMSGIGRNAGPAQAACVAQASCQLSNPLSCRRRIGVAGQFIPKEFCAPRLNDTSNRRQQLRLLSVVIIIVSGIRYAFIYFQF
jgi:hypothetical protein